MLIDGTLHQEPKTTWCNGKHVCFVEAVTQKADLHQSRFYDNLPDEYVARREKQ